MKTKNQTGLKNFKPKINLNHNIYMTTLQRKLKLKGEDWKGKRPENASYKKMPRTLSTVKL